MSMKYIGISVLTILFLIVSSTACAGPGHDHDSDTEHDHSKETHHHNEDTTESASSHSLKELRSELGETAKAIKAALAEESYKEIDDLNHKLEGLVDNFLAANPYTEQMQKKRFEGAVTQLKRASDELHEQGHHPTQDGISSALRKLEGAMQMLDLQIAER